MPVRVLIADNSAIMREAVRRVLSEEPGIEIVGEACDAREMIEMRKTFVPDIVIMDLHMAEESKMSAHELSSKSRLLAVSASDAEESSQKAKELGASAFLDKLWLHTTLIPKIFELCQTNR
jgi:two-component system chemotaxis response regulator CheB